MKKLKNCLGKNSFKGTEVVNYSPITLFVLFAFMIIVFFSTLMPSMATGHLKFMVDASIQKAGAISFSGYPYDLVCYAIAPMIICFSQLPFLHNKKACYTTLSFGQKRKSILKSRLTFPFAFMLVVLVVVKLVALYVNIRLFKNDFFVIKIFSAHLFTCIKILLFSYLCSLIGCTFCGKKIEALATSFSLFLLPSALQLSIQYINCITINGISVDTETPILLLAQLLNPLDWSDYFYLSDYYLDGKTTSALSTTVSIALIIIYAVAFFLVCKRFCNSYKPEKCGFKGINLFATIVTNTTCAIVVFLLCVQYIYLISYDEHFLFCPNILTIIIFIAAILSVFVCNFIIHFSIKKIKAALLSCVLIFATAFILSVINITCISPSFNKVPPASEIASVTISEPFSGFLLPHSSLGTSCYNGTSDDTLTLYEKEEIEAFCNIHNTIVEETQHSIDSYFYIRYTLKDGSVIERLYPHIGKAAVEELLKFTTTDAGKELTKMQILPELSTFYEDYEGTKPYTPSIIHESSEVTFKPKFGVATKTFDKPNKKFFDDLRKNIFDDISNMTYSERYASENEFLGTIYLGICYRNPENNEYMLEFDFCSTNVPVYSNMKKTIRYLKENGYYKYLHYDTTSIDAVYIGDLYENMAYESLLYSYMPCIHQNSKKIYPPVFEFDRYIYDKNEEANRPVNQVTDKTEISELLKKAQGHCYIDNDKDYKVIYIIYKNMDYLDGNCYIIPPSET